MSNLHPLFDHIFEVHFKTSRRYTDIGTTIAYCQRCGGEFESVGRYEEYCRDCKKEITCSGCGELIEGQIYEADDGKDKYCEDCWELMQIPLEEEEDEYTN